jgi:hypothetical protein
MPEGVAALPAVYDESVFGLGRRKLYLLRHNAFR